MASLYCINKKETPSTASRYVGLCVLEMDDHLAKAGKSIRNIDWINIAESVADNLLRPSNEGQSTFQQSLESISCREPYDLVFLIQKTNWKN